MAGACQGGSSRNGPSQLQGGGAALLLTDGADPVNQAIAAAAIGFTVGSEVDVIAYLASKHFGLKNFGALYGAMGMALGIGTAFGPLAAGLLFVHFGSYAVVLKVAIAMLAVSALALISLGAPTAHGSRRASCHLTGGEVPWGCAKAG